MVKTIDYERAAKLVLAEQPDTWSRRWTAKTAAARAAENLREMQILAQQVVEGRMTPTEFRISIEELMADPEFKEAAEFMEKVPSSARG